MVWPCTASSCFRSKPNSEIAQLKKEMAVLKAKVESSTSNNLSAYTLYNCGSCMTQRALADRCFRVEVCHRADKAANQVYKLVCPFCQKDSPIEIFHLNPIGIDSVDPEVMNNLKAELVNKRLLMKKQEEEKKSN